MSDVGFVGLGLMGRAMARRLISAGHTVHVWNRSPAPVDDLVSHGAVRADGPGAALATGLVFSMLADDQAVASVFTPELLAATPAGAAHVNMATVGIGTADSLASAHAAAGLGYLAAPVLGRPAVAEAGQLNIVTGGDAAVVDRARPYLKAMGKHVWEVGGRPRDASAVKLAVNFNLIHAIQALAESVTFVEAAGLSGRTFVDILTDTAFTGSAYSGYGPLIADRNYSPVFSVALGAKDLRLFSEAAGEHGVSLPTLGTLQQLFEQTLATPDLAGLDWSAIAELTRRAGNGAGGQ
jgi:3-hydroxyisobutyrate dehydrogenase-like beta-hydroxyacid dehydrogenase